jgi:hypothetical protein
MKICNNNDSGTIASHLEPVYSGISKIKLSLGMHIILPTQFSIPDMYGIAAGYYAHRTYPDCGSTTMSWG